MEGTAAAIGAVLTFVYNIVKFLVPGLTGKIAYWVFSAISFVLAIFLVLLQGNGISWATFPSILQSFVTIAGVALLIFNAIKFGPEVVTKALNSSADTKRR